MADGDGLQFENADDCKMVYYGEFIGELHKIPISKLKMLWKL